MSLVNWTSSITLNMFVSRETNDSRDVCWDSLWWLGPKPPHLCPGHRLCYKTTDWVLPHRQYIGRADGPESHHQGTAAALPQLLPGIDIIWGWGLCGPGSQGERGVLAGVNASAWFRGCPCRGVCLGMVLRGLCAQLLGTHLRCAFNRIMSSGTLLSVTLFSMVILSLDSTKHI